MALILRLPGARKREKLWREGAQTEGVVTRLWWHSKESGTFGIEFRVRFPDGSTADVMERFMDWNHQGYFLEGDAVPVRYDATNHKKVTLDVPALEAPLLAVKAAREDRRDEAIAGLEGN